VETLSRPTRPTCDEVRACCRDVSLLDDMNDLGHADVLYHLRKCDPCRDELSAREYIETITLLSTKD